MKHINRTSIADHVHTFVPGSTRCTYRWRWVRLVYAHGTWYSRRMPRWISCFMGWSILIFTSSKVINCI